MKIFYIFPLLVLPLAGCQSLGNLTPAQNAALACLAGQAVAGIAAVDVAPNKAAAVAANGQVLCTTATGAAAIVSAK